MAPRIWLVLALASAAPGLAKERVIGRGERTIVEKTSSQSARIFAVTSDGKELLLDGTPPLHKIDSTRARLSHFLGRDDLLDVEVRYDLTNGMGGDLHVVHYLVRLGASDELACRFESESRHGMEDSTSSTTSKIRLISKLPLVFELRSETQSSHRMGGLPEAPTSQRYLIPESGKCRKK